MPKGQFTNTRPILKWAGGKRQLLPALRPYYPESFDRYIEPFVGSGAVFLDLKTSKRLEGRQVLLSDINADIIGCYRMVREAVEDVIAALSALAEGHRTLGRPHFYEVRDERFNPERRRIHAEAHPELRYTPELAAMVIYLNRTGYNGLFRVNRRGVYNVPAGSHGPIRVCNPDNLRRVSKALSHPGLSLGVTTFEQALADVGAGDFVYLDPPYVPVSRTSSLHGVFLREVQRRPAGGAAADRDRDCRQGRAGPAEQLLRARHQPALRGQRRGPQRRPDHPHGRGPALDQFTVDGAGGGPRVPDHQRERGRRLSGSHRFRFSCPLSPGISRISRIQRRKS